MKKVLCSIFFAFLAFSLFAQSAEKITEIIQSEEINAGQAAFLACSYTEEISESADWNGAVAAAAQKGWLSQGAAVQDSINLQKICGLFVKASGMKCGLLYRLTKADRYAFKELKANGVLDNAADPGMAVSGQNAVAILNACVKKAGGSK